jgi:hypothetical protein
LENTLQVDREKLAPILAWLAAGGKNLHTPVGNYDFCLKIWDRPRAKVREELVPGSCDNIGCIGGAIQSLYRAKLGDDPSAASVGRFVGLDEQIAYMLFFPGYYQELFSGPFHLPARRVARVLRKLMDENVLDWSVA